MSRELALELDQHGNAIEHPGTARVVYRLNLPMLPATAKRLFAAISVDTSLPKKRRRDREDVGQEVAMNDMEVWPKPPTEMTVVKLSYINLS